MGRYDQYSDEELDCRGQEKERDRNRDYLMGKYKEFVRKGKSHVPDRRDR